jgi:hypothetical protein
LLRIWNLVILRSTHRPKPSSIQQDLAFWRWGDAIDAYATLLVPPGKVLLVRVNNCDLIASGY